MTARSVRIAATAPRRGGWWALSDLSGSGLLVRRVVHGRIGKPIGVRVESATDMLERHAADLVRQQPRLCMQRLKARILDLVVAEHLLDEQQRIGPDMQLAASPRLRP